MIGDSKPSSVRSLDRINLRLPAETFEEIDASRLARAGNVSRNTWITEAVEEKLARERVAALARRSAAAWLSSTNSLPAAVWPAPAWGRIGPASSPTISISRKATLTGSTGALESQGLPGTQSLRRPRGQCRGPAGHSRSHLGLLPVPGPFPGGRRRRLEGGTFWNVLSVLGYYQNPHSRRSSAESHCPGECSRHTDVS